MYFYALIIFIIDFWYKKFFVNCDAHYDKEELNLI